MPTNNINLQGKLKARLRAWRQSSGADHTRLMILALIAGLVCGHAAVFFYLAIDTLMTLAFGTSEAMLATHATKLKWWHILSVTIGTGIIVGQLLRFLSVDRSLSVADVIESASLREGKIPFKDGLVSALITILSLGGGASTGREGPVVHLAATFTSGMGRFLSFPPKMARIFLGCGVAAAVAASFNAPLAGVFFALEVIIGHYALHTFTPIVISAIVGTLVSRAWLGDFPAFQVLDYAAPHAVEFPAFFLLGIVSAGVATVFMRSLHSTAKFRRTRLAFLPPWALPPVGGLLIGLIALPFPEILSVGYEATSAALNGSYSLGLMLALVFAKIAATALSLAFRFGGGVFSPSLFLGAVTGGSFGLIAATAFPTFTSHEGVYAVAGMGAVASAVLGAPISTILIVFELTGDYSVTIAVMIASAVASVTADLFNKGSFFHQQLAQRGIQLEGGRATYLLNSVTVAHHMDRDFFTVRAADTALSARDLLLSLDGDPLIVTADSGEMVGLITLSCLSHHAHALDNPQTVSRLTAADLISSNTASIQTDAPLQDALTLMEQRGENILAVTSSDQTRLVVGLVRYRKLMAEYNRALLEAQGGDLKN